MRLACGWTRRALQVCNLVKCLHLPYVDIYLWRMRMIGGADFTTAIGEAIEQSDGIISLVDAKYVTSTYCHNELGRFLVCFCPNLLVD